MKRNVFFLLLLPLFAVAQKKALTVKDFDQWKHLENIKISTAGKWVSYRIEPQVGDAQLVYHSLEKVQIDTLKRVSSYALLHQKPYIVARVTQAHEEKRALKLKEEKKENFPKDSLYFIRLSTREKVFLDLVSSWKVPEANGNCIAYLKEEALPEPEIEDNDSTDKVEKKKSTKKDKDDKPSLVLYQTSSGRKWEFPQVTSYALSHKGSYCVFHSKGDSLFEKGVYVLNTATGSAVKRTLDAEAIKNITSDTLENRFALLSTEQEEKEEDKFYSLNLFDFNSDGALTSIDSNDLSLGHLVSTNGELSFSPNGQRLFFGIEKKAPNYKKDSTILEEEKPKLDVWSHHEGRLQPQQQSELEKDKKASLLCFVDMKKLGISQLTESIRENISISNQREGNYALARDASPYYKEKSWAYPWARDVYLLNVKTQKKELILKKLKGRAGLSPQGKYMYWYSQEDGSWWLMDLKKRKRTHLNADMPKAFTDAEDDHPALPNSYGVGGWTENDQHLILNDRYGVWLFDPSGKTQPRRLGGNKDNKEVYRVIKKNTEPYISLEEPLHFSVFNKATKVSSEAQWDWQSKLPEKVDHRGASYRYYKRSAYSGTQLYRLIKSGTYSELFVATRHSYKQLSFTNPQQRRYKWYETELVDYINTDGKELQGVLYKPENFDPKKKYPMIVYFYEQLSDYINSYQEPRPSASTVSRSFYCSNDYFVFVPDIVYKDGQPGQSAFNCILPGVLKLVNERSYIDKDRLALQGQSWGGYQTAYLITKTDLFACGMAGAPVANMTSAYGGIRWGSGLSRAFQYERGQSRLGGDLWSNSRDYFENSPLFYADRVQTPLLIMHNDNDGAVPWYQGIEYFSSLRRLEKPVWMLVYNNEEHNLTKRANKVDLSHRMFGFFNYYLKDDPMPLWMEKGIPASQKGKVLGY